MNPEQYAAAQAAVTAGVASYVQRVAGLFTGPVLSPRAWLDLLALIFPEVQRKYAESALLGRNFYDSQRALHHPELGRNERLLSELRFDQFVENMAPARKAMSQADAPKSAVTRVSLAAVREVEMAGRRQIIGAVKDDAELEAKVEKLQQRAVDESRVERSSDKVKSLRDRLASFNDMQASKPVVDDLRERLDQPAARSYEDALWDQVEKSLKEQAPKPVRSVVELDEDEDIPPVSGAVVGWARVATGNETCAWCLMLISRGAELNHKGNFAYREAATAGINLDDETALDLWNEAGGNIEKFKELLYDEDDDESSMEKWHTGCDCLAVPVFDINDWPGRDSAKRALELWIDASGTASELIASGKSRTKNKYTETLNALRRRLDSGEIIMSNYAIAA